MKNTFGNQIKEATSGVRLTNAERSRMHAALMAHMHPAPVVEKEYEPAFEVAHDTPSYVGVGRGVSSGFGWLAGLRFVPATLALFGMVGAGVTFAAEDAVPGEILYPIKVNVTEEVRSAFTFSDEAEAEWQARLAERRLEEAETLAAAGLLDVSAGAKIALALEKHADSVRDTLERLEGDNQSGAAIAVGSRLETALTAHQAILSHIAFNTNASASSDGAGQVVEKVRVKAEEVAAVRARVIGAPVAALNPAVLMKAATGTEGSDAEDTTSSLMMASDTVADSKVSTAIALRLQSAAETQLATAEKTIASLGATLGTEAKAGAMEEVRSARTAYSEGVIALESGNTTDAARLFEQALMRAQKIEYFMRAEARLNINFLRGSTAPTSTATETEESEGDDDPTEGEDTEPTPAVKPLPADLNIDL